MKIGRLKKRGNVFNAVETLNKLTRLFDRSILVFKIDYSITETNLFSFFWCYYCTVIHSR